MPFPWAVPGGRSLRALCGPQGTAAPPRRQNAPRRPAAMAGEAHPVPSRTRKLSPRAPIVLRVKPVGDQDAAGRLGAFSPGGAPRRARGPFSYAPGAGLLLLPDRFPIMSMDVSGAFLHSCYDYNFFEHMPAFPMDVLLFRGDADLAVPLSYSQRAAALLPHCELRLITWFYGRHQYWQVVDQSAEWLRAHIVR